MKKQIEIVDGKKFRPLHRAFIFVRFDNGFCCIGYYYEDTNNIFSGEKSYLFSNVRYWFEIPET